MKHPPILLQRILGLGCTRPEEQLEVFALLVIGLLDAVETGVLSPADAVAIFFHADNCRFVGASLTSADASEVMARGTQLADLFDALDPEEARRDCAAETAAMRARCLAVLDHERLVA